MGSARNYFEDEDYAAPKASGKTIREIAEELTEIENLLTLIYTPEEDIRINELEVSDSGDEIFVTKIGKDVPHGIVIYKGFSEERVMNNLIGSLRYFPYQDEFGFIDFNIYPHDIKRRYIKLPDIGSIVRDCTWEESLEALREDAVSFVESQKEAESYMELTGMDFVSIHTAEKILNIFREYKNDIISAVHKSSL